ncbi:MAG: hypothetical protein EBZ59_10500 [Planctomycetia bacterium]|nr:hypothetical protein [Planctomycetia bacterium]
MDIELELDLASNVARIRLRDLLDAARVPGRRSGSVRIAARAAAGTWNTALQVLQAAGPMSMPIDWATAKTLTPSSGAAVLQLQESELAGVEEIVVRAATVASGVRVLLSVTATPSAI